MYVADRHCNQIDFSIVVLGLDPAAKQSEELVQFLKRESIRNSPYRDKMLQVLLDKSGYAESIGDIYIETANINEDSLEEIYLPAQITDNVQLFIKSVLHYNENNRSLRYLFAGKPGTAKTKIIRAIAKACLGKATFIFSNGNEKRIESLFEFAEMFSPVVLCIDDIDLMTGSRSEGLYTPRLASFLQKLDGFVRQDFFLLATTNDKRLVDLAASRPGRFDLVIDVNLIEPRQYLELVKSKTNLSNIVELFDNDVLSLLEVKKVTGAFIANIVKHLELIASFEPQKLSKEYLANMIRESHQGFYEEPEPTNGKFGFSMAQ
jgi:SpoVK/Ycf46/Vps4 family AAA+-type ATPase